MTPKYTSRRICKVRAPDRLSDGPGEARAAARLL